MESMPDKASVPLRSRARPTGSTLNSTGEVISTTGAVRSMLMPDTVTLDVFPARSLHEPVADCAFPSARMTGVSMLATPESASVQSNVTVTTVLFQPAAFGSGDATAMTMGGVLSMTPLSPGFTTTVIPPAVTKTSEPLVASLVTVRSPDSDSTIDTDAPVGTTTVVSSKIRSTGPACTVALTEPHRRMPKPLCECWLRYATDRRHS